MAPDGRRLALGQAQRDRLHFKKSRPIRCVPHGGESTVIGFLFLLVLLMLATPVLVDDVHAADVSTQKITIAIQTRLEALGFDPGPPDGQLSQRTRSAIRDFQRALGLPQTGEPSLAIAKIVHEAYLAAESGRPVSKQALAQARKALAVAYVSTHSPTRQTRQAPRRVIVVDPKIAKLQNQLKKLGFDPGRYDGRLGARTQGSIRAFQAKAGLPVTGEASPQVYALVNELLGSPAKAGQVLNAHQGSEIIGAMRFQRDAKGSVTGCSVQDVQLDMVWCDTFASHSRVDNCKVVMRSNAKVLLVKCS